MATWKHVPQDVVRAVVTRMEGEVVYKPDLLRGLGVPEPLVNRYVKMFRSNPDLGPTGVLYGPDGRSVGTVVGCHGIEMLRDIATDFDIPFDRAAEVRGGQCDDHLEGAITRRRILKLLGGPDDQHGREAGRDGS